MDLDQELALQMAFFQFVLDSVHGQLDDIGGAALDRRVHGRPFGKGPAREVLAVDFRQRPAAAEHGDGHARFLGRGDEAVHVVVDRVVAGKIRIDVFLGFLAGNGDIPGQAEVADAIDDAEVDGLGMGPFFRRDLVQGDAEDFRRRPAVDVLALLEAVDHSRVLGQVSQEAQFDLRIVARDDVVIAFAGHEEGAYLAALFGPDGDILQIRVGTAQTSRRRDHLVEMGIDAPRFRHDERFQAIEISGNEFLQGPEVQNLVDHGMLVAQGVEDGTVRRIARLGLLDDRQLQLLEEDDAELFRRIDVEGLAGVVVNGFFQGISLAGQFALHGHEAVRIDSEAVHFHDGQRMDERFFDGIVELCQGCLIQFSCRFGPDLEGKSGIAGQLLSVVFCAFVQADVEGFGNIRQAIGRPRRVEEIGCQDDVLQGQAARGDAGYDLGQVLAVIGDDGCRFGQDGEIGVVIAFGNDEGAIIDGHGQGRHSRDGLAAVIAGGDGDGLPFQAGRARCVHDLDGRCRCRGVCQMREAVEGGKAFQKIAEAQAAEELGHVFLARLGLEHVHGVIEGHVTADSGQVLGQDGLVLVVGQFFLQLLALHFVQVFVDAVDAAELADELERRLFADAGDTGDIIGRIAHEGLHVDDLGRRITVFGFHDGRRDGQHVGDALLGQIDRHVVRDQLQGVAVTGDDSDGIAIGCRAAGQGADDVVPFVAFLFEDADAQAGQDFADQGELGPQVIRCGLARSLVAVEQVVAEGVLALVEGDGNVLRVQFSVQFQ